MQPRLSTSRKWTPLPSELIQQIQSVFRESFQEHTKDAEVEAGGRIYPGEILIRVGFKAPNTLKQSNWEISIAYRQDKDNVLKLLHMGLDAMGALFQQLFTSEHDHDFPRVWESVDFEGRQIFVQYTTVNTSLEEEADRLLGISASATDLAQGDWDEDMTSEHIKAQLGLDDDDEEGEHGHVHTHECDHDHGHDHDDEPDQTPPRSKRQTH